MVCDRNLDLSASLKVEAYDTNIEGTATSGVVTVRASPRTI